MADTAIFDHYSTQFGENWMHLLQQGDNRLDPYVTKVTVTGKERTINQIGKSKARKITTRNGKTIASNHPFAKRWLRLSPYDEVYQEDEWDEELLGTVSSPKSEIVMSHAMAFERAAEQEVIDALLGDAYIGEFGTDAVALPNSQKVAVNYIHGSTGSNSGLTLAKLIRARSILGKNEALGQGDSGTAIFVCSQKQLDDLLVNVDQVSNSRYADVKALVDGKVDYFMGFKFRRTEQLPLDASTDVRTCVAYVPKALAYGNNSRKVKFSTRDDLNETLQIRTKGRLGATRTEEEGVVAVYTDESP